MPDATPPRLNKVPFWFADALLIGTAAALVKFGGRPLAWWEVAGVAVCGALGAWFAILPFLREYDAAVRLTETNHLAETTARLGQLDVVADRIASATSLWQSVQDRAGQTADLAQGVVDRLAREAETFAASVSRTADQDKQALKLEVDKLRRSEGEWLQAVGRLMDHVFALHVAAVRSRQPGLAEQIDRFHAACRESLRRVGFVPIVAAPDEVFDPRKHQTPDGSRPAEGTVIDETVAPGFVFQGQLLRPIIVKVVGDGGDAGSPGAGPGTDGGTLEAARGPETESVSISDPPDGSADTGNPA